MSAVYLLLGIGKEICHFYFETFPPLSHFRHNPMSSEGRSQSSTTVRPYEQHPWFDFEVSVLLSRFRAYNSPY